jgi:hypothetical protein
VSLHDPLAAIIIFDPVKCLTCSEFHCQRFPTAFTSRTLLTVWRSPRLRWGRISRSHCAIFSFILEIAQASPRLHRDRASTRPIHRSIDGSTLLCIGNRYCPDRRHRRADEDQARLGNYDRRCRRRHTAVPSLYRDRNCHWHSLANDLGSRCYPRRCCCRRCHRSRSRNVYRRRHPSRWIPIIRGVGRTRGVIRAAAVAATTAMTKRGLTSRPAMIWCPSTPAVFRTAVPVC